MDCRPDGQSQTLAVRRGGRQAAIGRGVGARGHLRRCFFGDDRLLVADRTDRVLEYDAAGMNVQRRIGPPMSAFDRTLNYLVMPVYTVCPKPGELYKTVTHI